MKIGSALINKHNYDKSKLTMYPTATSFQKILLLTLEGSDAY